MLRVSKDMLEASQIFLYDPPSCMQNAFIFSSDQNPVYVCLPNIGIYTLSMCLCT